MPHSVTYTLQGSLYIADTYIKLLDPTTNKDGLGLWVGERNDQSTSTQRSLIKPDFSIIPNGFIVSSAVLSLYFTGDFSSNARTLSVYRSLRSFTTTQATWNKSDSGTNWGTAGAANTTTDRESSAIGTLAVSASETLNVFKAITLDNTSVQNMLTGGSFTNNGFVIQLDTEVDDAYQIEDTDLANTGVAANAPKLVITGTPPSWMGTMGIG